MFQAWLDNSNPVLCCTGGPGVGKSVLTYVDCIHLNLARHANRPRSLVIDHILCEELSANEGIAYFYFDYREQDVQTPTYFIASVLRQLAVQKVAFPQPLVDFYERFKQDQPQNVATELSQVFQEVCVTFDKCFIVIDALDECNGKSHRKDVLRILSSLNLQTFRIFVTSRPHPHEIKQQFQNAERIQIEASEADLKSYCRRMIESNESTCDIVDDTMKEEVADIISRNARGMYAISPSRILSFLPVIVLLLKI